MRKIFLTIFLAALLPLNALAAVSYTRVPPTGDVLYTPFHISVSVDSYSDFGADMSGASYWAVVVAGSSNIPETTGSCNPNTTLAVSDYLDLSVTSTYVWIGVLGFSDAACSWLPVPYAFYQFETGSFSVNPASPSISAGTLTIASGTAATALASVGNIFSDAGVAAWVILAAALPLFFYVIKQLIGLLPKGRGKRVIDV